MTAQNYDVLIIGGGVTGLVCASLLRRFLRGKAPVLRIGVLDAAAPAPLAADGEIGLRVFAIGPSGHKILTASGTWPMLKVDRLESFECLRVWQSDSTPFGTGSIGFDAADSGLAELGHIVEHDWLRLALWRDLEAVADGSVTLLTGSPPVELESAQNAMTVQRADGTRLKTRLLVGADGSDSWVRASLRLASTGRDYDQSALVAHVRSEQPHQRTAWQCFTPSGPVALLPLADGRSSLVWSCAETEARELLALTDKEFDARLTAATGQVLGNIQVTTGRVAIPLAARHTHRYTGARFALIGDAAHQVHPLAGQGINLGLLDAASLADTLAAHLLTSVLADPGDTRVLRRYERQRKGANLLTMAAMEGLHRAFTSGSPGLTRYATAGLGLVDRLPLVKGLLVEQAAGSLGPAWRERCGRL